METARVTGPVPRPAAGRRVRSAGWARCATTGVLVTMLSGCVPATTAGPAAQAPSDVTTTVRPVPQPTPAGPPATAVPTPVAPALDVPVRSATLGQAPPVPPAPVEVVVPGIGVTVPVDPVGVAPDGQMEIPPHAERAGWYRFGAAPGQDRGTAVVAAHVDSIASAGLGPFARLGELSAGDLVEVLLDDGRRVGYEVTDVVAVPKPDVPWPDVFVRDGEPRLVLITCSGTFRRETGHYSDNLLVTARPQGP